MRNLKDLPAYTHASLALLVTPGGGIAENVAELVALSGPLPDDMPEIAAQEIRLKIAGASAWALSWIDSFLVKHGDEPYKMQAIYWAADCSDALARQLRETFSDIGALIAEAAERAAQAALDARRAARAAEIVAVLQHVDQILRDAGLQIEGGCCWSFSVSPGDKGLTESLDELAADAAKMEIL